MERATFVGLDLVRFVAACSVMLYHLTFWWWLPLASGPMFHFNPGLLRWGWVGVEVFFVLSGFVIAFSADGRTAGDFVKGRALRLYPAAWMCATITLLVCLLTQVPVSLPQYFRSILLSPVGSWVSGVYWTLGVEIVFYAVVAMFLHRRWSLTVLGGTLGLLSGAFWVGRAVDSATGGYLAVYFAFADTFAGTLTLIPFGTHFALGIMLWSMTFRGITRWKLAIVATCIGGSMIGLGSAAGAWEMAPPLLWLAAFALICGSILFARQLSRMIGRSQARSLGLMTYPLYLVHSELGRGIMVTLRPVGEHFALGVAVAVVLATAYIVVRLEKYPRTVLRRLFDVKTREPVAASLP